MLIAHYIYAPVGSGYWNMEQWQAWADNLIISHDELEDFVYGLSVAENNREVYSAIDEQYFQERWNEDIDYCIYDIIIGYYYLMYKEGRLSLLKLFENLLYEDDISNGYTVMEYEEAEHIYNQLRLGVVNIKRIDELLEPLTEVAKKQFESILSYMKI